ncbi:MAG: hypothetical protein ACRELD_12015 [Longimicrobiales bacterium]
MSSSIATPIVESGADAGGEHRNRPDRITVGLTVALVCFGAYTIFAFPAHHDVAWMLYAAGKLLDGGRFGIDIVEVNPPLIVYFSAVVDTLARALGVWNVTAWKGAVLVLALTSLALCWKLLGVLLPHWPRARGLLLLLLAFLLVPFAGMEFGQREHLVLILTMPYLIAAAGRARGLMIARSTAIFLGLLAGAGIALKPYFLPVWLGTEVYVGLRCGPRSWLRGEHAALVGALVFYGLLVLLFTPDYVVVARWALEVYDAYNSASPRWIASQPGLRWALAALTGSALAGVIVKRSALRELRWLTGISLLTYLAAVFAQNKGWAYHWLPVIALSYLLLALSVLAASELLGDRRRGTGRVSRALVQTRVPELVLALFLVLATATILRSSRDHWSRMAGRSAYYLTAMIDLVETHGEEGPIFAFSTNMQAGFPLVNLTGVDWGARLNSLWHLPGLYAPTPPAQRGFAYRAPADMAPIERAFFEAVITDLQHSRPTLLIVDTRPPGYVLNGFDYLEYFGQDGRFRELMAGYRFLMPVDRYRVFKRIDEIQT